MAKRPLSGATCAFFRTIMHFHPLSFEIKIYMMHNLDLMHATHCTDDPENGPPDAEQATCYMQIERAQVQQRAHHHHACLQMNTAILQDAAAVQHVKDELHIYRHKLEDKVYFMDSHVGELKKELKRMMQVRKHRESGSGLSTKCQQNTP
jgi:hypothetical protein